MVSYLRLVDERDVKLAALGPRPPWWQLFACRRWDRKREDIMAAMVTVHDAMLRALYSPRCEVQ